MSESKGEHTPRRDRVAKKVLVADDSKTIRRAFELTFAGDAGVEILSAGDVASAMAIAREKSPALVIADSGMGSSSGYDLCSQLKADPALTGIPVWIMTGPAERLDEDRYETCGASGHIRKPFDTQRIIDKVAVMSAPPDEEFSRPSYPPGPVRPAAPVKPPVGQKPAVPAATGQAPGSAPQPPRLQKATLMGGPVIMPGKPPVPAAPPAAAAPQPAAPSFSKPVVPAAKPVVPSGPAVPAAKPGPAPVAARSAPAAAARPALAAPLDADALATPTAAAALAGLSDEQKDRVLALVSEVVERTVWEIVPDLAEAIIREELARLLEE